MSCNDICIQELKRKKKKPNEGKLGFGKYFSDRMFSMTYENGEWIDKKITKYGNLSLSPAATVFHYGVEIFEGLKAYRGVDGKIRLFRPKDNFERMNASAERLCLPQIDTEDTLAALKTLVSLEKEWIPSGDGKSLYIRPFMFGNENQLGVHAVKRATFVIILSPVGSYYKNGLKPVKIAIESRDVRAVRGGTGYAKCGGNYAASLRAAKVAEEKGYDQVLWLDGVERKYVEEVGSMNVMFVIGDKVVTPMLTGSVLPGITRKSCIEILKDKGYIVEERLLSAEELIEAAENGELKEAFGTGTAAVISPVGELSYGDKNYVVNDGQIGMVAQMLYDELTGIQYGKIKDNYGWTVEVE